eukprot:CAMPEP_0114996132 /NCGR_PEP_ID=MMETSP0216-20121206/14131_1 /TAXON_ID=223996 /ORGANISM="Protocruzia adherens, Strain Boccale" /LENGTH=231 /DNA_ID=CAMNT_0002360283 /DNA_START=471 /DNA_END=1166 /DNA_ORIENTATION=-
MKGLPNIIRSYRQRLNSKQKVISTVNGHRNFEAESTRNIFKIETNYYKKAKYFQSKPMAMNFNSARSSCTEKDFCDFNGSNEDDMMLAQTFQHGAYSPSGSSTASSTCSKFNFSSCSSKKSERLPRPLISSKALSIYSAPSTLPSWSSDSSTWNSSSQVCSESFENLFPTTVNNVDLVNCTLPLPQIMEGDSMLCDQKRTCHNGDNGEDLIADMVARFDFNEFLQSGAQRA